MVVWFAVWLSVPFEEVPGSELLGAVGTGEVLRVPGLPQRGYYLAYDGFIAGAAASLLAGVDSLTAHVCLEITKHRIQVLFLRRRGLRLGSLKWARVLRIGNCLMLWPLVYLQKIKKKLIRIVRYGIKTISDGNIVHFFIYKN